MHLNEDQKIQVLLSELQERYSAAHKMRERSIQFTLWSSGMAIGLSWLLISQKTLVLSQCIALTLLVLALFTGASYFILGDVLYDARQRVAWQDAAHDLATLAKVNNTK